MIINYKRKDSNFKGEKTGVPLDGYPEKDTSPLR